MSERSVAAKSIVTRRAIVDIVRTAVQGSYGVSGFSDPSLGRRLLRWIGLDRPGVRLSTEGGIRLDVYVTVAYGMPIAEVARQVDSAVRYAVRKATGAEVASLAIHVNGLRYQATAIQRAEEIERTQTDEVARPKRRSRLGRGVGASRSARAIRGGAGTGKASSATAAAGGTARGKRTSQ
jgi:uncharacterized alkaline shock family protein YloU